MQKEFAQPISQKSPQHSATDEQCPNIEDLTLNERTYSIAQTNDQCQQKKHCSLFEPDFFKTKPIDKRHPRNQKPDQKKKHNYQRKVEQLQKKIDQLEKQIHSLRRNEEFCPQCRYNLMQTCGRSIRQLIVPEDYCVSGSDVAGTCQRSTSKQSVQFQKINFMTPLMMSPEMEEKSWIFLGTMMIAMGSKIMDVDGTVNVFKVLNQSVDSIRRQVQKCEEKINMDFFLSKQEIGAGEYRDEGMNFDPFFAKQDDHPAGFQLQGVKLESVQQYELIYDQKLSFSVKYEALIAVMQYLRQYCSIC